MKNKQKIEEIIQGTENPDGTFSHTSFWKMKKKMIPRPQEVPLAMKDKNGNHITTSESLKKLYIDTYTERLKPHETDPNFKEIMRMKSQLWRMRLSLLKKRKTNPWNLHQLEDSLKRLKNNKARDPHGMICEIFKEGFIGFDLKLGILSLLNETKSELKIPDFMKFANITSLYKSKGAKPEMENQRGIFGLPILKKVLHNILYNEFQEHIDNNMSNSNIGARKKHMSKDHLFIVYAVINSVKNGKEDPVQISVYDL